MKKFILISNCFHTPYELSVISNPLGLDDKFIGKLFYFKYVKKDQNEFKLIDKIFKNRTEKELLADIKKHFKSLGENIIILPQITKTVVKRITVSLEFKNKKVFSGKIFYERPFYLGYNSIKGDSIDELILKTLKEELNMGGIICKLSFTDSKEFISNSEYINYFQANRAKYFRNIFITCFNNELTFLGITDDKIKNISVNIKLNLFVQTDIPNMKEVDSLFKYYYEMHVSKQQFLYLSQFSKTQFYGK